MPAHIFAPQVYAKFGAVDTWITSSLLPPDAALESALAANAASDLDAIDVAPNEGKFLYLLAKMNGAKRILEIGTLGGYSAIWFAKAVGLEGKVITLELEAEHARIAGKNIENAGFKDVVEIKVGPAMETLEHMKKEGSHARGNGQEFDMVFIDADKENNVGYLRYALEMTRKGAVIVVDNVVRHGKVLDVPGDRPSQGVRDVFEVMKGEKRIECTAVQTVGPKGWDGFAVALVVE